MVTTVDDIDARLAVAVTFLDDVCKYDAAMTYIDRLLDARLIVAALVLCPSPPT